MLVTYEGSQAINQSLYEKLPFDSIKDFQPIATISVTPFFLIVGAQAQQKTLQEFISFARANPDKLTYGSAGNGSVNHLLGEMLKAEANIRIVHVPYKGAPQAIADVIGGHVDVGVCKRPVGHFVGPARHRPGAGSQQRKARCDCARHPDDCRGGPSGVRRQSLVGNSRARRP